MKRSLLFVVMAIGFVAAYVGGATFAPFSDESTATGNITAGTLVFSGTGTQTVTFDSETFCDNIAPGEGCSGNFTVTNGGSLTGMIEADELEGDAYVSAVITEVTDLTSGDGTCLATDWLAEALMTDALGDSVEFTPGDVHTITVTVSLKDTPLSDAINRCQDASAEVTVTVTVTQAPNPHDLIDDGDNSGL